GQLGRPLDRSDEALLVAGEGRQPYRVSLAQGDIAEQQAGVEGVVEVRQVAVLAAHASAAIEQENDLLVAFVLIFAGDRGALARRRLPVDLPQGVAVAEVAQLVEFQTEAATRALAHAELAEPVVHRHQLCAVQTGEIRVDAGLAGQFQVAPTAPQAQRAGQFDLAAGEAEVTTHQRTYAVAELRL